jgi:CRISPR/Cas system Type II protein with McrA/HNH and RuvC-like nuclease domain
MAQKKNIGNKILELKIQGKSYTDIQKILKCSRGTIYYHCSDGAKERSRLNENKRRSKHPFIDKISTFRKSKYNPKLNTIKASMRKRLTAKVYEFIRKINMENNFTFQDVINKVGENPKCYLTGLNIDINQPKTYEFDHIIPKSRGGTNNLDNLGICTKSANRAKQDMTPDEFINLCRLVIANQK